MSKKPLKNADLESLLAPNDVKVNPWDGLDPSAKRSGVRSFTIQLNDYEWAVIEEAAKSEGIAKAAFIRQSVMKRSKSILDL